MRLHQQLGKVSPSLKRNYQETNSEYKQLYMLQSFVWLAHVKHVSLLIEVHKLEIEEKNIAR